MQALHTQRLRLEPLVAAHAEAMFEVLNDPAIYTYLDYGPPTSIQALREHYRSLESRRSPDGREGWLNWIVFEKNAPHPLGYVQATVLDDGHAWVGYEFNSAHWGRGLAFEAMKAMPERLSAEYGVRRCLACVEQANARSIALLERLGFALTADVPQATTLTASERLYSRAL
jgi:[ribosomal protein S5]-alanine N-acetyltransferase